MHKSNGNDRSPIIEMRARGRNPFWWYDGRSNANGGRDRPMTGDFFAVESRIVNSRPLFPDPTQTGLSILIQ
jgi:hypothetical protein